MRRRVLSCGTAMTPFITAAHPRVACIGECMVELREGADGTLRRGYGGDTLNTAVYLARLGVSTDYVTALGDDGWSEEMLASWRADGIGTGLVRRVRGQLPGLYIIQTDAAGERRFLYWRDSAAARRLFELPERDALMAALAGYDLLYASGISLSIYPPAGREALFSAMESVRARGGRVAFDANFRPRAWPDLGLARSLFREAFGRADVVFASEEDLEHLFGAAGVEEMERHAGGAERVLKLRRPAVLLRGSVLIEAEPVSGVVDTTAAGDSFAAAYLAARLRGDDADVAARAGHRLAGVVIRHAGAIVPREVMPPLERVHGTG